MERLISLFRDPEPDGGYASLSDAEPLQTSLKVISDEPVYFQQLLEYLRKEKQKRSDNEDETEDRKDKSGAD